MKKLGIGILSGALLLTGISAPTTANAAKVHKGLPKALHNKAYYMNPDNGNYMGYQFYKSTFSALASLHGSHQMIHVKYKVTGSRTYYVVAKDKDYGTTERFYFKLSKNYKTLKLKDKSKDAPTHKVTTYKYTGHHFPGF